nr:hypothetical protein [Tanacetum cinerariifolium]
EADFAKLHLKDIKDMYLIYAQTNSTISQVMNKLIWVDELYKFSDGTMKPDHDILNSRLHNFDLGYNNASIPNRAWTEKDQNMTTSMLKKFDQKLLERWIMRSLQCFVGGRKIKMDYILLTQT